MMAHRARRRLRPSPSFSHFTSMAYLAAPARPNSRRGPMAGSAAGRRHRSARPHRQLPRSTSTIASRWRCASMNHVPLVFNNPDNFTRRMFIEERAAFAPIDARGNGSANPSQAFLFDIARERQCVRAARARGLGRLPSRPSITASPCRGALSRVAALIAADFPAPRLYYIRLPPTTPSTPTSIQADLHAAPAGPIPPTHIARLRAATWSVWAAATTWC